MKSQNYLITSDASDTAIDPLGHCSGVWWYNNAGRCFWLFKFLIFNPFLVFPTCSVLAVCKLLFSRSQNSICENLFLCVTGERSYVAPRTSSWINVKLTAAWDEFEVVNSWQLQKWWKSCNLLKYDVIVDYRKPLFRRGVTSLADTRLGDYLTGIVTNVTHFGAFVDVGVGYDGLVHVSDILAQLLPPGRQSLEVGDHVEVRVKSTDIERRRIGLTLVRLLIN